MAGEFHDNSTGDPISNDQRKSDVPAAPHRRLSARRLLIGMVVLTVAAIMTGMGLCRW